MKTCIWCLQRCDEYRNVIRPTAATMSNQDATAYRELMATACTEYVTNDDDNIIDTVQIPIEPTLNKNIISCPVDAHAQSNPACKQNVPGIASCPECGHAMCPVCHRHNVVQLSRVTGYVGDVAGWNEGKKQELKDRKRYNLR